MEFLFNSTEPFEKDLQQVNTEVKQQITDRVNEIAHLFTENKKAFSHQARKPLRVGLSNGFDSSLYEVRVNDDLRLILTVDDDPLFGQVIVTLMRVVARSCSKEAFRDVAKVLYPTLSASESIPGVIGG